jgi:hypothetical protein
MVRTLIGALAAVLWASAAHAQTASSNCYWAGTIYHCDTVTQPRGGGIDSSIPMQFKGFTLSDILNDAQQRQARQQEMEARQQQMLMQQQQWQMQQRQAEQARSDAQDYAARQHLSEVVHQGVAYDLKQGRCSDAVDLALQYGEIDLATQARSFCASSPPPAPASVAPVPALNPAPPPEPRKAEESHVLCITCRP